MQSRFEQEARRAQLRITPEIGALRLIGLQGREAVNELFSYTVTAIAAERLPEPQDLIGRQLHVTTDTILGSERHFDGIIVSVLSLGGNELRGFRYEMQIRPWLWLLGQRRNSRIFHAAAVTEIVQQICGDYPGHSGRLSLQIDHAFSDLEPREYVVQHRESDLDFLRRLLEEAGVNFHFTTNAEGHELVISNTPNGFQEIGTRRYLPVGSANVLQEERFESWATRAQYQSRSVTLRDYNFTTPSANLETGRDWRPPGIAPEEQELFDFPGRYETEARGKLQAAIRLGRARQAASLHQAEGDALSLSAGCVVSLADHPEAEANKAYLVLSCNHVLAPEDYGSGAGAEGALRLYQGSFELMDHDRHLYPPLVTPRPVIHGPQTGVVISNEEEEIDVDAYGRVLVLFHWDRRRAGSMRCRVSQAWAGRQWGAVFWPRIGMEVVVEFLEGDPDAPLVTGTVYNANNMPPFDLPANKTVNGVKTRSSKGGGGHNRLTFEDKKGSELVHLRAERNLHGHVLVDETREIGNDRSETVGHDQTETIGNDHVVSTGRDHGETIGRNRTDSIGSDFSETIGNNHVVSTGRDHSETIGRNLSETVGADRAVSIASNDALSVGGRIEITAGQSIELKVGASVIRMTGDSIEISSPSISVEASRSLATSAGMTASHSSEVAMTVTSKLVKIN